MEDIDLNDPVALERKFLHDISNKLFVIQGMSTFVTRSIKKGEIGPKDLERCEKMAAAVKEMTTMLQERRDHIINGPKSV